MKEGTSTEEGGPLLALERQVDTVIFDMDGTLYEDLDVYDRYAGELSEFLPPDQRDPFLAEWEASKRRERVMQIGMGYDVESDRLFRHAGGKMTAGVHWTGTEGAPFDTDKPLFGQGRLNIGDWWGLAYALAAHAGVPSSDRQSAFLRTREYMAGAEYRLLPHPGLHEMLEALKNAGFHLIAMSNSPIPSVDDVIDRLGIRQYLDLIVGEAHKPAGLEAFLRTASDRTRCLSIGDNFVNEIEPTLAASAWALYIDRHHTGMGDDHPRCFHVRSIEDVPAWLALHLLGARPSA